MHSKQANAERDNARQPYLLSLQLPLWLPLLLVPMWSKPRQKILSLPVAVFSSFRSEYAFVRWHVVQWALLTLVAVFLVFRAVSSADLAGLWVIGIAGWYVGNALGLWQANRGRCWLWNGLSRTPNCPGRGLGSRRLPHPRSRPPRSPHPPSLWLTRRWPYQISRVSPLRKEENWRQQAARSRRWRGC